MKALSIVLALALASTSAHAAMEAAGSDLKAGDTAIAVRAPTVACDSPEHGRLVAIRLKMLAKDFTDSGIDKAETAVIRHANAKHCAFFKAGTVLIVEEAHLDHACVRAEVPGVVRRPNVRPGCLFVHTGNVDPWPARLIGE